MQEKFFEGCHLNNTSRSTSLNVDGLNLLLSHMCMSQHRSDADIFRS